MARKGKRACKGSLRIGLKTVAFLPNFGLGLGFHGGRVWMRLILCLTITVFLTACTPRGVIQFASDLAGIESAVQPVFIATNRVRAEAENRSWFSQEFGEVRHPKLQFARMDVSIPPTHELGEIEWPGQGRVKPSEHFVVKDEVLFSGPSSFLDNLNDSSPSRDVFVFVHGFNVNNAEAVYRLAQIAHDYEARLPVIAFSWPSAGNPRGYVYDRDSVIFSRDGLEKLLSVLIQDNRKVFIVAHSMGSQLVMETLRQMSISGKQKSLNQLAGVALISPDIDEDVFLQQAQRIKPFPQPFTLMVNTRDRALGLSAFLTGKQARLGSISDPARVSENLPVDVIDLSDVEGGDRVGHATAFTAPAAIRLLRRLQ